MGFRPVDGVTTDKISRYAFARHNTTGSQEGQTTYVSALASPCFLDFGGGGSNPLNKCITALQSCVVGVALVYERYLVVYSPPVVDFCTPGPCQEADRQLPHTSEGLL